MKRKIETDTTAVYPVKHVKNNEKTELEKFIFLKFCEFRHDAYICDYSKNSVVSPKISGSRLIAEYYGIKYGCNIEFALKPASLYGDDLYNLANFFLTSEFTDIRKKPGNYRKALLWGMDSTHAIPVIYIKEGGQEGILIANSLGTTPFTKRIVDTINKTIQIDVYTVLKPRQADVYSCYTDALVFARDATSFCADKTGYYIPDLLAYIKKSGQNEGDFFLTKLPDELLKTCQISSFLNYHQEKNNRIIHNNETLAEFRGRYTDRNVNTRFEEHDEITVQDIYSYPRKKGLKFVAIMKTQFYLNQVSSALDNALTREQQLDFICQAKKIINRVLDKKREEQLILLAQSFIKEQKSPTDSNTTLTI